MRRSTKYHVGKEQRKRRRKQQPTVSSQPLPDRPLEIKDSEGSGDDEVQYVGNDSASAYQELLQSLQAGGGGFAQAYAKRQREEQGLSCSEGDEEGSEDGESDVNEGEHIVNGVEEVKEEMEGFLAEREGGEHRMSSVDKEESGSEDDVESHEESVQDDTLFKGESDGTCFDTFKLHLEYTLTETDVARLLEEKTKFKAEIDAAGVPESKWVTNMLDFPKAEKRLLNYRLKLRLEKHWKSLHKGSLWGDFQTERQCQFFAFCNSYRDILHSKRLSFYISGEEDDSQIMDAYLLHILNHIFKTRDLVTKNNEKLTQQAKNDSLSEGEPPRDQGFTRPKVLILLPLRSIALRVITRLLELVPPLQKVDVEHLERFLEDFGAEEENSEDFDGNVGSGELKESENKDKQNNSKPADFQALFGGNNDDHFRIGVKFTRKSVKLYSDFYSSDIILASPLGLITRIEESEMEKDKDVDFLSSIEILVVDYADVIHMQNWTHVCSVVEQLNRIPSKQHGTDFMRIREWYLNGQGRFYRQSIVLSAFAHAGINALFHRAFVNFTGKLKLRNEYRGILSKVLLQVRQVYERIECNTLAEVDDARFHLFCKQVFPQLKDSLQGGTMIFVSSYFEFVRLRNFLKSQNASFCLLGEYTKQSDISRARAWFFHGKRQIFLYTERAHFYHRYKIRGIKDLFFYSLPEHAEYYAEITNMLEGLENPSSMALFSRFDNLQLERVVGTSRANKMLNSKNRTFMFC